MLVELSVMEQRYQAVLAVVQDGRTFTSAASQPPAPPTEAVPGGLDSQGGQGHPLAVWNKLKP